MCVIVHKHLYCDGCGRPYLEVVGTANTIHETIAAQRRDAKRDGWLRIRRKGKLVDLCDQCAEDAPERK